MLGKEALTHEGLEVAGAKVIYAVWKKTGNKALIVSELRRVLEENHDQAFCAEMLEVTV